MIIDKVENLKLYERLLPELAKIADLLDAEDFAKKEPGRYDIDGDKLYYIIASYETIPASQCKLETHKKYIDLQIALKGHEFIGYTPLQNLAVESEYDAEKDCALYKYPEKLSLIDFKPGMFTIFFKDDAHMPAIQAGNSQEILKVVFKIAIQ